MPLLERLRVEVYIPDLPSSQYENLLRSLEEEFTYAFGGSSIIRGLEGCYLSETGDRIMDRVNLIYSDAPLAVSTHFATADAYMRHSKQAATEALAEEVVLVSAEQVYHAVR